MKFYDLFFSRFSVHFLFWSAVLCLPLLPFTGRAQTSNNSTFGGAFTPHGDMRILIVFAGFADANGSGAQKLNHWEDEWPFKSLPDYVDKKEATAHGIVYSDYSDFETYKDSNHTNLSRLYYEMSLGKFRLVGDVFNNPRTGKAARINIDPTASNPDFPKAARSWGQCNARVLHKMRKQYPDFDWSPYDNRTNSPGYKFDGVEKGPDGKPDFIIIVYRHNKHWKIQPLRYMERWHGSGGGYSVMDGIPPDFEYNGYTFDRAGFTQPEGQGKPEDLLKYMEHEIAHELYSCPHVLGANGAGGRRWAFPASGYGMMSSWAKVMRCANGWERWVLGWIDLTTGQEQTSSDIQSAKDLNETGEYVLRDFITTGDAVRVKIPNTEDQYLWIENHQKESVFDEQPWVGAKVSKDGELIPPSEKGIYMYVENVLSDRTKITRRMVNDMTKVNGIRLLNAQGNFDYNHSEVAPEPSWDYFWRNTLFTYQRAKPNPISGSNPYLAYPDDYPIKSTEPGSDGKIGYYNHFNGGQNESNPIVRETNGSDTRILYAHLGGVNTEARQLFGRRSNAFQVGDSVGLSGIMPVLNFPLYNKRQSHLEPYVLNGMKVVFVAQNEKGEMTIRIEFNDRSVNTDQRWCGRLILPAAEGDGHALEIQNEATLLLDRSGTADRHTPTSEGTLVNPTTLSCQPGSSIRIAKGSQLIIDNGSTMILSSESILVIEEGAQLILRNGAGLIADEKARIVDVSGAGIKQEAGTLLQIPATTRE